MEYSLDEITDFLNGGAWSENEYVQEGIHVVKVSNLIDGSVERKEDDHYLPESKSVTYAKHRLQEFDVVVATVGSHPTNQGSVVGRTSLVPKEFDGSFLNQNAVCLRSKDTEILDQRFLYYLTKTVLFKHHIESRARGSANQVRMALGELKKFRFDYPAIEVQRKVVALLGATDAFAAVNERRIRVLQSVAEQIYREWFVRLRFPGAATTSLKDGIPVGWNGVPLREVADVNSTSIGKHNRPNEIRYVDIGSVTTNRMKAPDEIAFKDAPGRARRIVQHGDIIWSSVRPGNRAYCLLYEPAKNMVASTGFAVIRPKKGMPFSFLHQAVTTEAFVDEMVLVAKGAAYPATSFDDFERALILLPTVELLKQYHESCSPLYRMQHELNKQNLKLIGLRELMFDRLMSGRIDLGNLNIRLLSEVEEDAPTNFCEELAHA